MLLFNRTPLEQTFLSSNHNPEFGWSADALAGSCSAHRGLTPTALSVFLKMRLGIAFLGASHRTANNPRQQPSLPPSQIQSGKYCVFR
jgi:hypothetical protein